MITKHETLPVLHTQDGRRIVGHPGTWQHDITSESRPIDPDAATGCADDQVFAAVPVDLLRRIADA